MTASVAHFFLQVSAKASNPTITMAMAEMTYVDESNFSSSQ
jgi:hypothetical protein